MFQQFIHSLSELYDRIDIDYLQFQIKNSVAVPQPMNSQMFDKMDDFFKKKDEEQQDQPLHDETNNRNLINTHVQLTNKKTQNPFKNPQQLYKGPKCLTKTKWDVFQPRAFCKLSQRQKDQHFLKLFDDYLQIKMKLNEEAQNYKKLLSRKIYAEKQLADVKRKSPDKPIEKNRKYAELNENQQLKQQVKKLHEKIIALTGNKHKINNTRPQSAKHPKVIAPTTQNIKADLQMQRRQVRQLLIIIDELKSTKFSLQSQLKQKQQNQSSMNNRQPKNFNVPAGNESQFQSYLFDLQRWKQKYTDMQVLFDKMVAQKDTKIRQLQIDNISLRQNERNKRTSNDFSKISQISNGLLQQKANNLQIQKQNLQNQIRRLVSLPFNQSNNGRQQIQLQDKCSKLQLAVQKLKDQLTKTKQSNSKYLAQLEFKTRQANSAKSDNQKFKKQIKQLIQKQTGPKEFNKEIDYDDYYRKLMGIVKLQGEDPVWRKFASLATPNVNSMTQSQLKIQVEQLWKNKLQLLAHLQKAQIELKTIQQSTDSRVGLYLRDKQSLQQELRVARARLDEWTSMQKVGQKREIQIYQWAGIKYDDSISVFEADESQLKQIESKQNYFDLYLGQLNLDQASLFRNPNNKIKQINQLVSFLTVDFYNHDTQHSHFIQGNTRKLDNNFSFKVQVNQALVKYFAKQTISLELWSPQGSSTVLLGKGQIWLRDIINNSTKDISAIIKGKCPVYQQDKSLVATIQYRIRMRLPIGAYSQWAREDLKQQRGFSNIFKLAQRKKLQIKIIKGFSLPSSSASFVYFSLQGEDFFTQAIRGSTPQWNYKKQIELMLGEQLEEELKQNYFQLTLFDDDKPVNEDLIGTAKADLTRLIDATNHLDLELEVKNANFEVVGKIKVQFNWVNS